VLCTTPDADVGEVEMSREEPAGRPQIASRAATTAATGTSISR